MVSDDVAVQVCKRRSSLGIDISLTAAPPNLTWRDKNINATGNSNLTRDCWGLAAQWAPLWTALLLASSLLLPQRERHYGHFYRQVR